MKPLHFIVILLHAVTAYSLHSFDAYQLTSPVAEALHKCCKLTSNYTAVMACANSTAVQAMEPLQAMAEPADREVDTRIGVDGLVSVVEGIVKNMLPASEMNKIKTRTNRLRLGIISYANAEIASYAAHAALINAAWAKARGYAFTLADPRHAAYEPRDSRWNKVKIVEQALSAALERPTRSQNSTFASSGDGNDKPSPAAWGFGLDYILWLDSDLVILDFNLDVERDILNGGLECVETGECTNTYLQSDLIASRDPRPENGLINTGALLVKVTPSSLRFFRRWWEMDRAAGMDQHAFDRLWESQLKETSSTYARTLSGDICTDTGTGSDIPPAKVLMLPPHYLNSHFPAWKNQKADHAFLHLAGMSSVSRRTLFQRATTELCRAASVATSGNAARINLEQQFKPGTGTVLSHQLGLEKRAIQSVFFNSSITLSAVLDHIYDIKMMELYIHFSEPLPLLSKLNALHSKSRDYRQAGYNSRKLAMEEIELDPVMMSSLSQNRRELDEAHVLCLRDLFKMQRALLSAILYKGPPINKLKREVPTPHYTAEILQLTLDAGFNLASSLKVPSERLATLDIIQPALALIQEMAASNAQSNAAKLNMLYFVFKHECFRAIAVADSLDENVRSHGISAEASRQNAEAEVKALSRAWAIWEELQAGSWSGAGNQLADPGREAFEIRARYGALLCEVLGHTTLGFRALEQAIVLLQDKWGSRISLLNLPINTLHPGTDSHATDIILKDIIDMKRSETKPFLDVHIPPYALSAYIGVYLASASCAIKHVHNGDKADSSEGDFPRSDNAVKYTRHAFKMIQHVKKLIADEVWGYERDELQDLLNEYIPAAEKVFRLVRLSVETNNSIHNQREVSKAENKMWRRRKRSSPLAKITV